MSKGKTAGIRPASKMRVTKPAGAVLPDPTPAEAIAVALHAEPHDLRSQAPVIVQVAHHESAPVLSEAVSDVAFRAASERPAAGVGADTSSENHAGSRASPSLLVPMDMGQAVSRADRTSPSGMFDVHHAVFEFFREAAVANLSFWTTFLQPRWPGTGHLGPDQATMSDHTGASASKAA